MVRYCVEQQNHSDAVLDANQLDAVYYHSVYLSTSAIHNTPPIQLLWQPLRKANGRGWTVI